MAQEAQLGLGIGRRGMRGIRPALAREIHTGIARIIRRLHRRGVGLLLEALLAAPSPLARDFLDCELLSSGGTRLSGYTIGSSLKVGPASSVLIVALHRLRPY